jgi:AraC-like DNA-binding protein
VRAATARLYLGQPDIALAEVGYLLEFSDQTTFNRAFKRWTGATPRRVRLQALGAGRARPGE